MLREKISYTPVEAIEFANEGQLENGIGERSGQK